MQINRSHFSVLGNHQEREACLRTAQTVNQYCIDRLEQDKTWATSDFGSDFDDPDLNGLFTVKEVGGTPNIEGEIPSLSTTFTCSVDNQMASAERVELVITASGGGITRTIRSTLRPAPLYDSGIAAGGGVNISADEWTVGSRDPYRNLVRAKHDILAPDFNNINIVGKTNSAGETGDDHGIFWAKDDIAFYQGGLSQSVTDPVVMQDAMTATGGRFIPNSGISHPIHDLQVEDVVAPAGQSDINAGDYRFTEATATYERYEQTGTDSFGNPEYSWVSRSTTIPILGRYQGSLTEYWYTESVLSGTVRNVSLGLPGTGHVEDSETFSLDAGSKVEVTLDTPTTTPSFAIQADGAIDIAGEFKVTSTGEQPLLSFSGNGSDSQIKAEGDVVFQGSITGNGIIMSKNGNVELEVTDANTTGNDLGVSIFANGDININSIGSGTLNFSGLLFARENVSVNGVAQDFNVDGALVARNGNINISTSGKVDLTYNPEHLKVLLEKLPDNRTKLETLIWKE